MVNTGIALRSTVLATAALAFSAAFVLGSCNVLDPSPKATITEPSVPECEDIPTLRTGEALYRCQCANCHGPEGEPLSDRIADIRGFAAFDNFEAALENGPASMPVFREFDDEQRMLLFEYVRDSLGQ